MSIDMQAWIVDGGSSKVMGQFSLVLITYISILHTFEILNEVADAGIIFLSRCNVALHMAQVVGSARPEYPNLGPLPVHNTVPIAKTICVRSGKHSGWSERGGEISRIIQHRG